MKLVFLFLFKYILYIDISWAAACCGGVSSGPSLILGDEKAQMMASYSNMEVVVDSIDSNGDWHRWPDHQQSQTLRIGGAHIFKDRWQGAFSLPFVKRTHSQQEYSGVGDLDLNLGYEYLPDWDYNPFRPKGIGFLKLIVPNSKAKAESEQGGLDSFGNGFWALGIGTILTKATGFYDFSASADVHRSFNKTFSNSQMSARLSPGYGGNVGLGMGYNLKLFRFGGAVTWTYEDPIEISGITSLEGAVERYATSTLSISTFPSDDWVGILSYSDQTLIGSPVNTSLGKSVALSLQRRWKR